jgi:hypothetical protein
MNRVWRLMLPLPRFESDPEKTRHAQLLHVVSLALFVVLTALIFINLILDSQLGHAMNAVLAILTFMQVITQVLIKRGHAHTAAYLLFIVSWIGSTWIATKFDGVCSVVLFAYFTIILGAGYVVGSLRNSMNAFLACSISWIPNPKAQAWALPL